MSEELNAATIIGLLDEFADDDLHKLRQEIDGKLAQRLGERRTRALAEIHHLAKAHGLNVAVKKRIRRRGRPPKADGRVP